MMNIKTTRGFSLIEVLLAFIIVSVSAAGLVKLQNSYLKQEGSNSARESAMHLAENKLDELRSFTTIKTTAGEFAYQDIQTDQGNAIGGDGTLTAGSHTIGNTVYNLHWNVTNINLQTPALPYPDRKDVIIVVTWTNYEGGNNQLQLASSISAQLSTGDTSDDSLGASDEQPQIAYTEGAAPDVVAVTIKTSTGTKEETSKPLPTVYQSGDNTVVQTETITYDPGTGRKIQEDVVTLSCNCSLQSGKQDRKLPAFPLQDDEGLFWGPGNTATKSYGANTSNQNAQSPLCNVCCANHFDGAESSGGAFDQYYHIKRQGHGHYRLLNGSYVAPGSNSYLEACRLLRIDGFYEPMPDWNLVALNIMSPDFLSEPANQANYERYVQEAIRAHVAWQQGDQGSPFTFDTLNTWLGSGKVSNGGATSTALTLQAGQTVQLIARGVYVDYLNSDPGNYLSKIDPNETDALTKISFNELNLTLLSNWTSPDPSYATVTSEPVQTIVDASQNYYGTYSRGRLAPLQATPLDSNGNPSAIGITTQIRTSNSGITSTTAISPDDTDAKSATIDVKIIAGSGNNAKLHVTGDIKCLTDPKKAGEYPQVCKANEWSSLSVNHGGVACVVNKPTGSSIAGYFDCEVNRNSAVTLNFGATGFSMTPSSITLTSAQTSPTDADGHPLATLDLNAGRVCTVMMVKSTVPPYKDSSGNIVPFTCN